MDSKRAIVKNNIPVLKVTAARLQRRYANYTIPLLRAGHFVLQKFADKAAGIVNEQERGRPFVLILDKPYVSDLLRKTAEVMKIPVLDNGHMLDAARNKNINLTAESEFLRLAGTRNPLKLYCNSENSINWITGNLSHTDIPKFIDFCKDKVKFRKMERNRGAISS